MALAAWGVLAGGKFHSDKEEQQRLQSGEKERAVSRALETVAKEIGTKHITAVAIAYVMQKVPYVFPIIGGRKVEQLEANLEALAIVLTPEHIKYLESIVPFDPGFPITMIGDGSDYGTGMKNAAYMEKQPALRAIVPDAS